MTSRTILIVDDDNDLRSNAGGAARALRGVRHVLEETTCRKGHQQAARANGLIDLLIMDVGLPDMDGREAVKVLRKGGFKAPIIMLTGHDTDSDTILGLEAGANDYVTKPFRFAVLLARIRAQLRQHEQQRGCDLQRGALHVQARPEAADSGPARQQDPVDGEGGGDHQAISTGPTRRW
jgi:DNA-binding response OmpR family regulator